MSLRGFSLHLYCGHLINCGHVFIFISLSSFVISIEISILNSWLILGHFLFLFLFLSISSKLLSSIFFFPHFFSSKSPLGHNISCLMIYLGSVILISRTLSFVRFDQIYQFFISPLYYFDFDFDSILSISSLTFLS